MKNTRNEKGNITLIVLGVIFLILFVVWGVARIYLEIQFDRHLTGHIKRAADANTIELAAKEMQTVVGYLEKHDLTDGYTSVLYTTPDEDIGFWYTNLKQSLDELRAVNPNATQLEKSNVLMKLRETLLDEGGGTQVTEPQGISVYPHNVMYFIWGWMSFILGAILTVIGIMTQ